MAFDVYVGTFTRFYRRDWENVVQRQARESGTEYRMIYAGGEPEAPAPAEEVRGVVTAWREAINQQVGDNFDAPLKWDEADDRPYFTDRPAWQGYGALMLWAAYASQPGLKQPRKFTDDWMADPAFLAAVEAPRLGPFGVITKAGLWLPGSFNFAFNFVNPAQEEAMIASTRALLDSLSALNEATFKGTAGDLAEWRKGEGADGDELEPIARFGFSIFHGLAEKAVEHQLPVILSF